jgi:hypothetical protein
MRINPVTIEAHPGWSDSVLELREVVGGEIRVALITVRSPYVLDQLQRRLTKIRDQWAAQMAMCDR